MSSPIYWWVFVEHPDCEPTAFLAETPWENPARLARFLRETSYVAGDDKLSISAEPLPKVQYETVPPRRLGF